MKKVFCLILSLMLIAFYVIPHVYADDREDAFGFNYQVSFHLHDDAFRPFEMRRLQGYIDLLDSLSFSGFFSRSLSSQAFEFSITAKPNDSKSKPVSFLISGTPRDMIIDSPLFGDEKVTLYNDSLLQFALKTYEHLGIQLQNLILCFPYTYTYAFHSPLNNWNQMLKNKKGDFSISSKAIKSLTSSWDKQLETDTALHDLIDSFCIANPDADIIREEFLHFPAYIRETVTKGKSVKVRKSQEKETWITQSGNVFISSSSPEYYEVSLHLPETSGGFTPFFHYSDSFVSPFRNISADASYISDDDKNLLLFHFDVSGLPDKWPTDCLASGRLQASGSIFPELDLSFTLTTESDGSFVLSISRNPDSDKQPPSVFLTVTGNLSNRENDTVAAFNKTVFDQCVSLLNVNDESLTALLTRISGSLGSGLLRFLTGIPASSCQSIMDDLTEVGILDMLLSE